MRLDEVAQRGRLVDTFGRDPLLDRPRRGGLGVQRHERHEVASPVADHDGFADQRVPLEGLFEVARRDILSPCGDQDLFFSADDL